MEQTDYKNKPFVTGLKERNCHGRDYVSNMIMKKNQFIKYYAIKYRIA